MGYEGGDFRFGLSARFGTLPAMAYLRTWLVFVCVALAACASTAASAQDGAAEDEASQNTDRDAEAREHFQAGHEYFANTEYEDALVEFQRAYELASEHAAPAMLFNVASTLERLGRFDESADALERYLEEAEEPETPARLRARIVSLRRRAAANRGADAAAQGGGDDGLILGSAVLLSVAGAGAVAFAVLGGLTVAENDAIEAGCFAVGSCVAADVATLEQMVTNVADA